MTPLRSALLALPLLLSGDSRPLSDCGRNLSRLEGWTIIKSGSIKGSFQGCNFDKLIELMDGTILRCSSYGYQYAYMPDAVIFGRSVSVQGKSAVILKMLVEDEVYDMSPVVAKP